jgi:NADPH:quinone reductase-like Zn-dependent oxidoreductase
LVDTAPGIQVAKMTSEIPNAMPATMQAWQYTAVQDKLENALALNDSVPIPETSALSKDQIIVETIAAALNPVDQKMPEAGLVGRFMIPRPAVPGLDFCGRVIAKHPANDAVSIGQVVFGALRKVAQHGTLSQYVAVSSLECAPLPEGVDPYHAAGIGTAGISALQSLLPEVVVPGSRVLINGGSGGVGTFTIQFAKAMGAEVTTTCSAANVELCKSLGADEVLNYKAIDVVSALVQKGLVYDLVIDNVGNTSDLYDRCDAYLKPSGAFIQVGIPASMVGTLLKRVMLPGVLRGQTRRFHFLRYKSNTQDFESIGRWMREGKVKTVVDSTFEWRDVPKAFERLRTGRARGKVIVRVENS